MGGSEGGTIEHTNSQTDVLLGPFVTVDGGQEVLKSSKISSLRLVQMSDN